MGKNKYTKIGNDSNSPFIRNYIFSQTFFQYPELFSLPQLPLFIYSDRGDIAYFADLDVWKVCHEDLQARVKSDPMYLQQLIDETLTYGEACVAWAKKHITENDFSLLSSEELCKLYEEFVVRQSRLYAYGVLLPILDWQDFSYIEKKLRELLLVVKDEQERGRIFEVCTQPAKKSFAQDQEMALLVLMQSWYQDDEWRNMMLSESFQKVATKFPEFTAALESHANEFFWVYYAYAGPAYGAEDFFELVRINLQTGIDPTQKLEEYINRMRDLEQEKEDFFDRYNISDYDKQTVQLASLIVWAKPRRKDFQSALYASVESLQKYIGKRLHLSLSQIRSMAPEQIRSALVKDVPADIHLVNEISACHVCLPDATGDVDILVGRQSKEFFSQQNAPQKKEYIANADEMFGACAYRGKATGVVKIINRPEDMQKMNIGDVLVSIATTPSIVMAMKKASAIITDEGGLTCHASIVSRELGIPCVVGVKIATSILQDGDIVEVDATHAKVTKI